MANKNRQFYWNLNWNIGITGPKLTLMPMIITKNFPKSIATKILSGAVWYILFWLPNVVCEWRCELWRLCRNGLIRPSVPCPGAWSGKHTGHRYRSQPEGLPPANCSAWTACKSERHMYPKYALRSIARSTSTYIVHSARLTSSLVCSSVDSVLQ